MDFIQIITKHTVLIAIVIIAIFLLWQFYLKNKLFSGKKKVEDKKEVIEADPNSSLIIAAENNKPDTTTKRIGRGFGVMMDKIRNSDYVKGVQAEQETAKSDDMLPKGIFVQDKEPEDNFSTDLSKLTKVDF